MLHICEEFEKEYIVVYNLRKTVYLLFSHKIKDMANMFLNITAIILHYYYSITTIILQYYYSLNGEPIDWKQDFVYLGNNLSYTWWLEHKCFDNLCRS